MKVIIAGGRDITDYDIPGAVQRSGFHITEVVCGKQSGIDTLGEEWAKLNNIPVAPFPADWKQYHNAAGPIRNAKMADYAEALILIWNGKSPGSADMLKKAKRKQLKVHEEVLP